MSEARATVSIIVGSVRPVRIGRQLADAIAGAMSPVLDATVQILDLKDIGLPLLDEPLMPALHRYTNAHTFAWADMITASDAVVFLTPQYNRGYPASVKNAVDYLFAEWKDRPGAIVSYGRRGGGAAAAQLRQVLEFVGVDLADTQPQLAVDVDDYTTAWVLGDPADVVARHTDDIRAMARELDDKIAQRQAEAA